MLQTIQVAALLQGLFLLSALFINRKDYKRTTFWLLFGSLLAILLYIWAMTETIFLFTIQIGFFLIVRSSLHFFFSSLDIIIMGKIHSQNATIYSFCLTFSIL